jgi:hypothetical protein
MVTPSSALLKSAVQLATYGCGAATGEATRVFTVIAINYLVDFTLSINQGSTSINLVLIETGETEGNVRFKASS